VLSSLLVLNILLALPLAFLISMLLSFLENVGRKWGSVQLKLTTAPSQFDSAHFFKHRFLTMVFLLYVAWVFAYAVNFCLGNQVI
jgi:hypothetical protein